MTRFRLILASVLTAFVVAAVGFYAYGVSAKRTHVPSLVRLASPAPIITDDPGLSIARGPSPEPTPAAVDGERIQIQELGIDLPIVQGDGVNVPLYKAAVLPTLAWPGQGHRSMVYAHARPGMFGPLWNAHVGTRVSLAVPNAKPLHYTIQEFYPSWPVSDPKWLRPADQEQLVLLTCTSWNDSDPRVVAVAYPD